MRAWVRPFLFLAIIVAAPLLLFAFVYVPREVAKEESRGFETLAVVATKLGERLQAYDKVAASLSVSPSDRKQRLTDRAYLSYLDAALETKTESRFLPDSDGADEPLRLVVGSKGELELRVRMPDVPKKVMAAPIHVEDLVRWPLVTSAFDGLLILGDDGTLIGQDRRLPMLSAGQAIDLHVGEKSVQLADVLAYRVPPAEKGGTRATDLGSLFTSSSSLHARVAGVDYLALVLPVSAPIRAFDPKDPKAKARESWLVVCALLREDSLRQRAIALSPQVLTWAIAGIALGLLAIPFLKLRFIHARERMRARDVWLLASSFLLGSAIAFLLLLHAAAISQIRSRFDRELESFAGELVTRAQEERAAALSQLRESGPDLLAADEKSLNGAVLSQRPFSYALFDSIFAAGFRGNQRQRWATRTLPASRVSIRNREYLRDALALAAPGPSPSEGPDAAFSAIVSMATGKENAVFALPADLGSRRVGAEVPLARRDGIVAITTPFVSLNDPPVPAPFEFVVLDGSGRVIFQAAPEAFRDQHFYEAIAPSESLGRALLQDGRVKPVSYRGHLRQMVQRPIPQLDATLIAFYDRGVVESLAGQILAVTAVVALGIAVSLLGGGWLVLRGLGADAASWLWPSPDSLGYYRIGALLGGIEILVFAASHFARSRPELLWLALVWPAAAVFALHLERRFGVSARLPRPQVTGDYPAIYVVFAVTSLVALVGVPLAFVFEDSFSLHVAAHRDGVGKRLESARAAVEPKVFVTAVGQSCSLPPADTLACGMSDRVIVSPTNLVALRRQRGELVPGQPPSDASVVTPAASSLALVAERVAHVGRRSQELVPGLQLEARGDYSGPLPRLDWSEMGGALWFAFALALAALALLVHMTARHVLGLSRRGDGVLVRGGEPSREGRKLLLRPPENELPGKVTRIDLRDAKCDRERLESLARDDHALVLGLESRLDDPEWRPKLLQLAANETLENLVFVSEIDPLHYLAQRLREAAAAVAALPEGDGSAPAAKAALAEREAELGHWAEAFARFDKIRFGPPARPDAHRNADSELAERLWRECSWSQPLANVYATLVRRPDIADRSWDEVVSFVTDAAESHYHALWALCSRDERLALIQLAEEGLVNPKSAELMRRLARRRLVRIDPNFRLMNESFREFVRGVEAPERVAEWEKVGRREGWARIGTPLWALGLMAVALLLLTEQEALTNLVALATAASSAVGSLRSIYATGRQVVTPKTS